MSETEVNVVEPLLYTLIPKDDFKSYLGIDDRDDKLSKFCLVTSTFTIEQYCKRRFLLKKYFEIIDFYGDLFLPLKEYPVSEVLVVYSLKYKTQYSSNNHIIEPEFYEVIPDCDSDFNSPFSISLSPAVASLPCKAIKIVYWAGYSLDNVPGDLAAACFELAAWNMNRYKGRRIGMSGNIKGTGIQGEHFELSLPENVRTLLEPYKRKTI